MLSTLFTMHEENRNIGLFLPLSSPAKEDYAEISDISRELVFPDDREEEMPPDGNERIKEPSEIHDETPEPPILEGLTVEELPGAHGGD